MKKQSFNARSHKQLEIRVNLGTHSNDSHQTPLQKHKSISFAADQLDTKPSTHHKATPMQRARSSSSISNQVTPMVVIQDT